MSGDAVQSELRCTGIETGKPCVCSALCGVRVAARPTVTSPALLLPCDACGVATYFRLAISPPPTPPLFFCGLRVAPPSSGRLGWRRKSPGIEMRACVESMVLRRTVSQR